MKTPIRLPLLIAVLLLATLSIQDSGHPARAGSSKPAPPVADPPAPDFTNVSDILGGRRRLLPVDDLVVTSSVRGGNTSGPVRNLVLPTASSAIGTPVPYDVVDNASSFVTGVGRMFNLPSDVIVTMTPGSANLAIYDGDTFLFTVFSLPGNPSAVTMADFTGDGLADMALLVDRAVQIVTAKDVDDHDAGFFAGTPGTPFSVDIQPGTAITAGDFNGDGDREVAIAIPQGGGVSIVILDVAVIRSGTQITDIRVSEAGILFIPTPVPVTEVALTAGDYDGAINVANALPDDELVVAYRYDTNLQMSSIDPVVNSDNPNAYTPMVRNSLSVSSTVADPPPNQVGLAGLASGRLNWFGTNEQVVVGFHQSSSDGTVSPIIVFTLDSDLNLSPQPGSVVEIGPVAGIALGNFAQALGSDGPPNLQIATLNPQTNTNNTLFVRIYQADPQNNFALSNASSNRIELLPSQGCCAFAFAAGDTRGRSLLLGEPTKLTVEQVQPRMVLGVPPIHVDWVTDANGSGPEVLNLSAVQNAYYSSYQLTGDTRTQTSRQSKTSFTEAVSATLTEGYQWGGAATGSISVSLSQSAGLTYENTVARDKDKYTSEGFDVSVTATLDDHVWYIDERQNLYSYPVIGQTACPAGKPDCSASERLPLTVIFSAPDQIKVKDHDARSLEWFQPVWEPGNIFSYPWNLDQLKAQYPSVNLLTSSTPETFFTDSDTRTQLVNWAGGQSEGSTTGNVVNISWDASASVTKTPSNLTGGFSGSVKVDYNGSRGFQTLSIATTKLEATTGIGIHKPSTFPNPDQYQYAVQSFIFGNGAPDGTVETVDLGTDIQTDGILQAAFTADPTDPAAGSWWGGAYNLPDVALNHPARWHVAIQTLTGDTPANCIKTSLGPQNSCATFNAHNPADLWNADSLWMKGLLITPASANGQGPQIAQATAGDQVRLQARVYNYSLTDMPAGSQAVVQFYGQAYQMSCSASDCTPNTPIGDSFLIENVVLGPIPGFNSASNNGTLANWAVAETTRLDTAAHADQHLIFWVLVVLKDQEGNPLPEMPGHGLTGVPPTVDSIVEAATWLEPYSNNLGYYHSAFYIAPQTAPGSAPQNTEVSASRNAKAMKAPGRNDGLRLKHFKVQPRSAPMNEKVSVSVELHAGDQPLERVAVRFYDGDPNRGGKLVDEEHIVHIRANERAEARVPFRAATCGVHTLYVETHPQKKTAKTTFNVRSQPASVGRCGDSSTRAGR
jgi:hypothetical protein